MTENSTEDSNHAAEVLAELTGRDVEKFRGDYPIPDFEDQEVLKNDGN